MDPATIKTAHISMKQPKTVTDIVHLIRTSGYDRYQFSDGGGGCRWWIYSVITLLQRNGFFDREEEYVAAVEALQSVWESQDIPVRSWKQTSLSSGAGRFFEPENSRLDFANLNEYSPSILRNLQMLNIRGEAL